MLYLCGYIAVLMHNVHLLYLHHTHTSDRKCSCTCNVHFCLCVFMMIDTIIHVCQSFCYCCSFQQFWIEIHLSLLYCDACEGEYSVKLPSLFLCSFFLVLFNIYSGFISVLLFSFILKNVILKNKHILGRCFARVVSINPMLYADYSAFFL